MDELKERYSKLTNEELLNIVNVHNSDYTAEAKKIAREILSIRGLNEHSVEMKEKHPPNQKEENIVTQKSIDIFKFEKLKESWKGKKWNYIGQWLFWYIVLYGVFSGLSVGSGKKKFVHLLYYWSDITTGWLFVLEVAFNIAIFGMFPVIFLIILSAKLSSQQRKEQKLSFFMPKYIFFTYTISIILFVLLVFIAR